MSKRFGMAYIKVDTLGLLPTMPGASLDMGGKVRTPVVGDNAVLGFSEQVNASMIECEISLGEGMSLAQLQDIAGSTITFECDSGQSYVISDAFLTDSLALTAGDGGKVKLKFNGQPAEELL